ncbi:putative methyltransferase-domain-containing protein [Thelephora terrestris]|uniref:Methyltransferase-domain-containing protein n=1 Tax=Thelephora terrestris TaxID=56493 RepID=A0A9P6L1U6_9AGAM|nr:putative methyltransferase-domain-containing protein [Thelephora terrestris]
MDNPNFPPRLEISPSENDFGDSAIFGLSSQKSAIQKYGIAGRVWEASYTLTTYLESKDPRIVFDPPSPFSTQRHLLSTLTPERWGPNLNRDENWCPNSSKSNPRSNLDVEDVLKPLTILELGSGTGIIIAKLAEVINKEARDGPDGDVIIATDLDNVCPLLEENLSSAAKMFWKNDQTNPRVLVRPLEWGVHKHSLKVLNELGSRSLTHIVCSDLVYFPHLLAPLLRTLIHLTSAPPSSSQPSIIISYRIRSLPKELLFWSAFGLWFSYGPVLYRRDCQSPLQSHQGGAGYESDRPPLNDHTNGGPETEWARYHAPSSTYIFIARRKTVSLGWSVPEDDKDLLEGVGAHENQRQKADDTFELMLLMDLADNED